MIIIGSKHGEVYRIICITICNYMAYANHIHVKPSSCLFNTPGDPVLLQVQPHASCTLRGDGGSRFAQRTHRIELHGLGVQIDLETLSGAAGVGVEIWKKCSFLQDTGRRFMKGIGRSMQMWFMDECIYIYCF